MKKRTTPEGQSTTEHESRAHKGFALVKQYRGDMFAAASMGEKDATLFREAMVAMQQAGAAKDLLGEDMSSARAADVFTGLASRLQGIGRDVYNTERTELEEAIALLASIYNLRTERQGIGDILQAARDNNARLPDYINRLRSSKLRPIILEACTFLGTLRAD